MLASDLEPALHTLVQALAGPRALPAGGAAGVVAIAMGTALGKKVLAFSPDLPAALRPLAGQLDELLQQLLPEFAADCDAFEALLAAFALPRTDGGRSAAIQRAWQTATAAPERVATLAGKVEALLQGCSGKCNANLAGDLAAARELVRAGQQIAVANAAENARHLHG